MNGPTSHSLAGGQTETYRGFVLWMLSALHLEVEQENGDRFALRLSEQHRESFGGAELARFRFVIDAETPDDAAPAGPHSQLVQWIQDQIQQPGGGLHAAPAGQPTSVHELTGALFSAYEVEGGRVKLGGCKLVDRPLVRLTFCGPFDSSAGDGETSHYFFTPDGQPLDEALKRSLHLDRLSDFSARLSESDRAGMAGWIEAARRPLEASDQRPGGEMLAATIVWCKYAEGKLSFEIGDRAAELPFSGWAQRIADRVDEPPPYVCPTTGKESHHLAATDDGVVTVVEAIAACGETGKRVVETDLRTCADTGQRALAEFFEVCPVSGARVIRSAFAECPTCGQRVSSSQVEGDACSACRSLTAVGKDDPRMARVLGEYPRLDDWSRWRIAETAGVYVLTAAGIVKRLLAVVDKQSLEVLRLATGSRLAKGWTDVSEHVRGELLR